MSEQLHKMHKARAGLILDQPFFGALALKLRVAEDATCEKMWSDGVTLGFNPEHVGAMPIEQLKAALCVQLLKLANQHHCRRGERDGGPWNKASEYAVTSVLKDSRDAQGNAMFTLPKDALQSDIYKNVEAEKIYTLIKELEQKNGGGGGQGQGQGNGQGQQPQQGNQPGQGQGKGQGDGQGKGKNKPQPGCGEVRDYPGKDGNGASEAEKEQQKQDWKIATQQAAQAAKACGKLPGDLLRLVEDVLEPVVDWREALRQFVDRISRNDYSFRRPNTRFMSAGVIMPTLYNHELPPIVVAVDTSGSVSPEDLKQFAGEIEDILTQYPTELTVLYADTSVRSREDFTADNRPVKLDAKGGGGTRFSPTFRYVAENMEEAPVCLVYLTDLLCSDFGDEPEYPVLWVNTGSRVKAPPWGELVRMKNEQ